MFTQMREVVRERLGQSCAVSVCLRNLIHKKWRKNHYLRKAAE